MTDLVEPCKGHSRAMFPACRAFIAENSQRVLKAVDPNEICVLLQSCTRDEAALAAAADDEAAAVAAGSDDKMKIESGTLVVSAADQIAQHLRDGEGPRQTRMRIAFPTPYSFAPFVHLGISSWDVQNYDDVRVRAEAQNIDRYGFDVQVSTWKNAKVDSIAIDWIAYGKSLAAKGLVRSGRLHATNPTSFERKIQFPVEFKNLPEVTISITGIDALSGRNVRAEVSAAEVTVSGFTARFRTWDNSQVRWVSISWMAFDSPGSMTRTGIMSVTDADQSFKKMWVPPLGERVFTRHIDFTKARRVCGPAAKVEVAKAVSDVGKAVTNILNDKEPGSPSSSSTTTPPPPSSPSSSSSSSSVSSSREADSSGSSASTSTSSTHSSSASSAGFDHRDGDAENPELHRVSRSESRSDRAQDFVDQRDAARDMERENESRQTLMDLLWEESGRGEAKEGEEREGPGDKSTRDEENTTERDEGQRDPTAGRDEGKESSRDREDRENRPDASVSVDKDAKDVHGALDSILGGGSGDKQKDSEKDVHGALDNIVAGGTGKEGANGPAQGGATKDEKDAHGALDNIIAGGTGKEGASGPAKDVKDVHTALDNIVSGGTGKEGENGPGAALTAAAEAARAKEQGLPAPASAAAPPTEVCTEVRDAAGVEFVGPPGVRLELAKFDFASNVGARVQLKARDVSATGFTLEVRTWADTRIKELNVQWIAHERPVNWDPRTEAKAEGEGATKEIRAAAEDAGNTEANPGKSCKDILTKKKGMKDGVYWISPTGTPVQVFCDMANGGWTRVVNLLGGSYFHADQEEAVEVQGLKDTDVGAKLSDSDINAIKTAGYFRFQCGGSYDSFVTNSGKTWTSKLSNSFSWLTSRDRNPEAFSCKASLADHVFGEKASTDPRCRQGYTMYAASSAEEGRGCYVDGKGWGQSGSLWVL